MGLKNTLFAYSVFILCTLFLGGVAVNPVYSVEKWCAKKNNNVYFNMTLYQNLTLNSFKKGPRDCKITLQTTKDRLVIMSYSKYHLWKTDSLVFQDYGGTRLSLTGFGDFGLSEKFIIFKGEVAIHYVTNNSTAFAFEFLFTHANEGPPCSWMDEEFECFNGKCIPPHLVCDEQNNCGDFSDEIACRRECKADEFRCNNGRCLQGSKVCDAKFDCGDRSDEDSCTRDCNSQEFECRNFKCIKKILKCNKKNDCGDWSDEMNCCTSPDITDENEKAPESSNPWLISTVICGVLLLVAIVFITLLIRRSVVNKNNTGQTQPPVPSA